MFEVLLVILDLAAEALGELLAVPDQQLLLGLHRFHGVEEDVPAVLAGHQVLLGQGARWVNKAHPVAVVHVIAVNKVKKLTSRVNLSRRRQDREERQEDRKNERGKRMEEMRGGNLLRKSNKKNSVRAFYP